MADIHIGDTITVTRTEVEEPNIIDVDDWMAYRVINGVTEGAPIDTLSVGDGITITEPVGDEGVRTYTISWTHVVEGDVNDGDTYQILFVPGGTASDQAGILDWLSDEYDVEVSSSSVLQQSLSLDISVGIR
jgi:hypothetical protein